MDSNLAAICFTDHCSMTMLCNYCNQVCSLFFVGDGYWLLGFKVCFVICNGISIKKNAKILLHAFYINPWFWAWIKCFKFNLMNLKTMKIWQMHATFSFTDDWKIRDESNYFSLVDFSFFFVLKSWNSYGVNVNQPFCEINETLRIRFVYVYVLLSVFPTIRVSVVVLSELSLSFPLCFNCPFEGPIKFEKCCSGGPLLIWMLTLANLAAR